VNLRRRESINVFIFVLVIWLQQQRGFSGPANALSIIDSMRKAGSSVLASWPRRLAQFCRAGIIAARASASRKRRRPASMINKIVASIEAALADVPDGATIMLGGFGSAGLPTELIDGLIAQGARELTIVNNNAGNGDTGLAALLQARRVRKIICSFPRQVDSYVFDSLYRAGQIELELVPQGNLAERIRAAGAGIGAFYTPTGYGTDLARGKETRVIDGRGYVLEYPIRADYALIKAERGDRWGNLTYRKTARNFGPIMAAAARITVATVHEVVELGGLDPEAVVTPGLYVARLVHIARQPTRPVGVRPT
jgi:3-oxoadipate CoA-transferase alpha subunit